VRKLIGEDKDSFISEGNGEGEQTSDATQPLTTSHKQADVPLVSKQQLPWKAKHPTSGLFLGTGFVFIAEHDI